MSEKKTKTRRTEVINGDVYCSKCGKFIGMTCDPFRDGYCKKCFKD